MKTITISAAERTRCGKGGAREARREGRIPGILYGQGQQVPLTVDRREFARALLDAHTTNVIFDLSLPGKPPLKTIAREIQTDPVSRLMIHVDFQHIDMSRKINVSVAVILKGEPDGVKNFGGILEHVTRDVEIMCLPADIPESITVDVSHLGVGDAVHVSELPAGFEYMDDPHRVIALVAAPTVEKTAAETAAEAADAAATAAAAPAATPAADAAKS